MMTVAQAKKEIARLRKQIDKHNYHYYVLNDPLISDYEYDKLYKNLESLEKRFPQLIILESPTQRVGGKPLKGFKTVIHKTKMLSLDNTYSEDDLKEFDKRIKKVLKNDVNYEVTLKVDGVAVALLYEDGKLVFGSTRGDGVRGDDVTQNLRTIRSLPLRIITEDSVLKNIEVRGEVFLPVLSFTKLNKEREDSGLPQFVNPRNAAAGTLKLLAAQEVARRGLDIFIHTIPRSPGGSYNSHYKTLKALGRNGFKIIPHMKLCTSVEQVHDYITKWQNKRETLGYEVDGLVIKVDNYEQRELLGTTMKSPRWAIAYKYPACQVITKIKDIIVQVGRTGRITPVALLEPVFLSGSTISRATLHNEDEIKKKDIRINDLVVIEKGGEVIPKVVSVVRDQSARRKEAFKFPGCCPVCREKIVRLSHEANWRCVNTSCPAQLKGGILHFASRPAMDIEGFGDILVEQLVDTGLVKRFDDIYRLEKDVLVKLERMADKSAQNLVRSIEQSKDRDFTRVLYGLGIPNIGVNCANILVDEFGSIESMINAEVEEYEEINGIGNVIAESTVNYFKSKHNLELINELKKFGLHFTLGRKQDRINSLRGKTFVFTGELSSVNRSEVQAVVRKYGGHPGTTVSKKTDYLVYGSKTGSKYRRAKKLGIRVLSELEFFDLIKKGRLL